MASFRDLQPLVHALATATHDGAVARSLVAGFTFADAAWAELALDEPSTSGAPGTRVLRAIPGGSEARPAVHTTLVPGPRPDAATIRAPTTVEARGGVLAVVVLPLVDPRGQTPMGVATIACRRTPMLADDALALAAAIVAGALTQARTLLRVASLSRRAHVENRVLRDTIEEQSPNVVFRAAAMRHLFEHVVPAVARQGVTVLVRGETGVGKELVARRIHALSPRAARPLVTVNCGAIPEHLVDATLFGHERGAFTGATARHIGMFERAHRGTLFLDEVGELSLPHQARLLRVLEDHAVDRVGGARPVPVDVRVVAATHRDLEVMVRAKTFRADLFHRLAVVPLVVPPLRERPEDIEPIARHVLGAIARRTGTAPLPLRPRDLATLRAMRWPGNVRELENVIERGVLLGDGRHLALEPVRDDIAPDAASFDEASRRAIAAALAASHGHIHGADGAAARLGLKPTTLQSKMKKLGFERPRRQRARR